MSTSAPVTLETLPEVMSPVSVEVQTSETVKVSVRAGTLDASTRKFDVASIAKFDFTPIMPASAPMTLETLPEVVEDLIHTLDASAQDATLDVAPKIAIPKVTPIKPSITPVTLETLPEVVEDSHIPTGSRAVQAATFNPSEAISFRSYPPKIMTPRLDVITRSSQKTLGILPEILEVPVPLNTPAATPDSATLDIELETVSMKDPGEVSTPTQDVSSPTAPMDTEISSLNTIIDPFTQINVPDIPSALKAPRVWNKIKMGKVPTNISPDIAPDAKNDVMSTTSNSRNGVKYETFDVRTKTLPMTPETGSGGPEHITTPDVAYDASSGIELDNVFNVAMKPSTTADAVTGGNGMTCEPTTVNSTPSPASEAIFTVDAMPEASESVNRIRHPQTGRVLPYHMLFKSLVCCFAPHTARH